MKLRSVVFFVVAILGVSSSITFAANQADTQAELDDLKKRIQYLEQRVATKPKPSPKSEPKKIPSERIKRTRTVTKPGYISSDQAREEDVNPEPSQNPTIKYTDDADLSVIRDVVRFGTGPYFGLDATYDGSDLLINEPSINKDLGILRQNRYLNEHIGHVSDSGPRVQFSGNVEVWGLFNSQPFGIVTTKSFMGASADLDFAAQINSWWTGYIRLDGDVAEPSIVTLDQSFIILGDLQQLPFYATLGRLYIPSGAFFTNMASSSVVRKLGRTKATSLVTAMSYEGIDAAVFAYDGRTARGNVRDHVDEWGAGLQYTTSNLFNNGYYLRLGSGFNSNIASSEGFTTAAVLGNAGDVHNFVPAVDIHGMFGIGIAKIGAEYLFLTNSFKYNEVSFDDEGAKPTALNIEMNFSFTPTFFIQKPTVLVFNYGSTTEAAAVGLPEYLYGGTYQIVAMKNTLITLEYLRKRDYGKGTYFVTQRVPEVTYATNNMDNQFRAQVDVFF